jgi:hypothetical protein
VLSTISTTGTRCCCASASAEITAASARTTVGVNPDRRTRQVKKADHKHSTVSSVPSHQPETWPVAASTAIAVNKTAPPRRSAIAYQPASQCRAWSDGPPTRERRARPRPLAGDWICSPTKYAAGSTGPVCDRTREPGTITFQVHDTGHRLSSIMGTTRSARSAFNRQANARVMSPGSQPSARFDPRPRQLCSRHLHRFHLPNQVARA